MGYNEGAPTKINKKLLSVIEYLIYKISPKSGIYQTKMHKLLYFCDFAFHEKYETYLTASVYIKNHHGPTSKDLMAVRLRAKAGLLDYLEIVEEGDNKVRFVLKNSNRSDFGLREQEIEMIDMMIAKYGKYGCGEIRQISHNDIPWKYGVDSQEIPYQSVFYRTKEFSVV